MLRSLFSGITGLRSNQTMMDIVGNNIANVNTVGYKSSQGVFEDTLSEVLTSAGAPQGALGGTNPAEVGLGVKIAGITTNFGQGAAQLTGRSTDMMVQGDGFFLVNNGTGTLYTRAGSFSLDASGQLVAPDGAVVQGWQGAGGVISTNAAPTPVKIPIGTLLAPKQTAKAQLGGNLPADAVVGTSVVASITAYDAQGTQHAMTYTFTNTSANNWNLVVTDGTNPPGAPTALVFSNTGALTSPNPATATYSFMGSTVTMNISGMTQYGGANTASALSQDGSAVGSLQSFAISPDGTVTGVFSNGLKQSLAQIALASFNNPAGLEKVGDSMYRTSVNSGSPQLGIPGTGGRGMLAGGVLEMSNVDLAAEFSNLIIAQRALQANSKVITASDEVLQDLVNLKR
ncbi:MAG TPA: flagellar hook protein FlgE [Candidatus Nanopelagicaceae bacterium]|nr:flagellar hook protein FlgE [Candidatus Nanopelagicaceae bacterium]